MRAVRICQPDVLVGDFAREYWLVLLPGRYRGLPVVLFCHRILPTRPLSAWGVPRLADRFFAVSRHARHALVRQGIPASRVQVLYNPADVAALRPDPHRCAALKCRLGFDEDAIVVGYVGRMYRSKGIFVLRDALQEAMARELRLRCLWLGDGPSLQELRERMTAGAYADRHRTPGWIEDPTPYYGVMTMLAFPSALPETFGRVSVEAQAAGVPVLVAASAEPWRRLTPAGPACCFLPATWKPCVRRSSGCAIPRCAPPWRQRRTISSSAGSAAM